jgi:glycosyltransferase involved in cell wall biosynthesis
MALSISVIITNFNKGKSLLNAVESVANQLVEDDEIVIVDDCSTEVESIRAFAEINNITAQIKKLKTSKNSGSSTAKNLGIRTATKEIIVMLDADDVLPPNSIMRIRQTFFKHDEVDFVFGDYEYVNILAGQRSIVSCAKIADADGYLNAPNLAQEWILLGSSPFRKKIFEEVGGYNPVRPRTDDIDLQTKMISWGARGFYINEVIYIWNRNPNGNATSIPKILRLFSFYNRMEFYFRYLPPSLFIYRLAKVTLRIIAEKIRRAFMTRPDTT